MLVSKRTNSLQVRNLTTNKSLWNFLSPYKESGHKQCQNICSYNSETVRKTWPRGTVWHHQADGNTSWFRLRDNRRLNSAWNEVPCCVHLPSYILLSIYIYNVCSSRNKSSRFISKWQNHYVYTQLHISWLVMFYQLDAMIRGTSQLYLVFWTHPGLKVELPLQLERVSHTPM